MAAETLLKVLPESSTAHVGGVSTHEAVQRVVEARFSVVSVLGKGSFGAAVLVRPLTQPDNLLVLKIPTAIQARTILRSEAEILCSMSHPRVIGFRECIPVPGKDVVLLLMEYAESGSLADFLSQRRQRREPLPARDSARIIHGILQALEYIHLKNILHLDIKCVGTV